MEVCEVWLARDFLARIGRPIDIPSCHHSTELCPPISEGATEMTNNTGDPGSAHRAQSSGRAALDIARDLRRWADIVGPTGYGELAGEAANTLESLTLRLAEECTARGVAQAWLDTALPFLRDGALAEHHGQCGEAGQFDIRRCEDAHCLERAGLLELYGLLPKEWGAYLATATANPLPAAEQRCHHEYRPGHRDGWCGFLRGHAPIPHNGTVYQHGNTTTGWWWNELLPAPCGSGERHEPHVTDLGKWCDGNPDQS